MENQKRKLIKQLRKAIICGDTEEVGRIGNVLKSEAVPKGSWIVFGNGHFMDKGGDPNLYYCANYRLQEGEESVQYPPEYWGITLEEAQKICGRFEHPIIFREICPGDEDYDLSCTAENVSNNHD